MKKHRRNVWSQNKVFWEIRGLSRMPLKQEICYNSVFRIFVLRPPRSLPPGCQRFVFYREMENGPLLQKNLIFRSSKKFRKGYAVGVHSFSVIETRRLNICRVKVWMALLIITNWLFNLRCYTLKLWTPTVKPFFLTSNFVPEPVVAKAMPDRLVLQPSSRRRGTMARHSGVPRGCTCNGIDIYLRLRQQ